MNKLVKMLWRYLRRVQPWTLPSWVADCAWYLLYVLKRIDGFEMSQSEQLWIIDFWGDFYALETEGLPPLSFNARSYHVIQGLRTAPGTLIPLCEAFGLAMLAEGREHIEPIQAVKAMERVLEVAREFGDEVLYQQVLAWSIEQLAGYEDGSSYLDDFGLLRVYNEAQQVEPVRRRLMAPDGSDALEIFDEEEFDELWQQGFESEEGEDHARRL